MVLFQKDPGHPLENDPGQNPVIELLDARRTLRGISDHLFLLRLGETFRVLQRLLQQVMVILLLVGDSV